MNEDNYGPEGLLDELDKLNGQLEEYGEKLEGLQTVVDEYREADLTREGLYIAKEEVVVAEHDLVKLIDNFDVERYALSAEDKEEVMEIIERHFGDEIRELEEDLAHLRQQRRQIFEDSRDILSKNYEE